jgi:hypothetical protein
VTLRVFAVESEHGEPSVHAPPKGIVDTERLLLSPVALGAFFIVGTFTDTRGVSPLV